jgi:hypothetical protein
MKTTVKALAVGIALIALAGGCRSMTGRTAGQTVDNKAMVASVKTKLTADRLKNFTWVNVDANDGVVYLTGNTETAQQKARATELALRANGVKRVVNDLVVNSARDSAAKADARPVAASGASSSARSSARSSAAPAASPASTSSSSSGSLNGEVVSVDQGTGNVTLRMSDGNNVQLRLPPASVRTVRPGDRLSVSVSSVAR